MNQPKKIQGAADQFEGGASLSPETARPGKHPETTQIIQKTDAAVTDQAVVEFSPKILTEALGFRCLQRTESFGAVYAQRPRASIASIVWPGGSLHHLAGYLFSIPGDRSHPWSAKFCIVAKLKQTRPRRSGLEAS
jgi:hypothetical protein